MCPGSVCLAQFSTWVPQAFSRGAPRFQQSTAKKQNIKKASKLLYLKLEVFLANNPTKSNGMLNLMVVHFHFYAL